MDLIKIDTGMRFSVKEAVTFNRPIILVPLQEQLDYLNGLRLLGTYDNKEPKITLLKKSHCEVIDQFADIFVPEDSAWDLSYSGWTISFLACSYKD